MSLNCGSEMTQPLKTSMLLHLVLQMKRKGSSSAKMKAHSMKQKFKLP